MKGQLLHITPSKQQAHILMRWIGCQRFIYNAKVQDDRYFRTFARKSLQLVGQYAPIDQTYSQYKAQAPFLKEVPSQILRNGAVRWRDAYSRFFARLGGRPKIKQRHGRQSMLVTSELFIIRQNEHGNWFMDLGTKKYPVGSLRLNTRDIPILPRMICISVHAGRWAVSFATPEQDSETGQAIQYPDYKEVLAHLSTYTDEELFAAVNGVDRGVVLPACDAKGVIGQNLLTVNDRSNARKEHRKKRYQRQMVRQQKGSKRYQRTRLNVARIQRYRANCIKNMAHQVSHHLVADSTTMVVALEDLSLKNMTASAKGTVDQPGKQVRQKAGLNRSILQSGWGQLRQYLLYKTFQRGKLLVFVPPHYTSQECSRCGTIDKASRRHQSGFACTACGFTDNADRNAARVIARHAAYGLIRNKQPGQELSTGGKGKPKSQTPVELHVSREVIQSFHAHNHEAGNHLLNALR